MKNILYISYDGLTDQLGQSQILPYLKDLSKEFNISILSFEKRKNFESSKTLIYKILESTLINWIPLNYHKNPPVLSSVYDLILMYKTAKRVIKEKKITVIHCRSYIPAIVGLRLKNKFGIKLIFDMRGFWIEERVEGKIWNIKNPIYWFIVKYLKNKEKKLLESSDIIITLTNKAKNDLENRGFLDRNNEKIEVIPCCTDGLLFDPSFVDSSKLVTLKNSLGLNSNDFVLLYLGALGSWYLLDEMLDFFKIFKSQKKELKFLFVTSESPEKILNAAKKRDIELNDIIIKRGNRNEIPSLISLANFGIFFIKPSYSKTASSPVKLGEIMCMGIPVICNEGIGDIQELINEDNGILVKLEKGEYLNASIKVLNFNFNNKEIRKIAEEYFSLSKGVAKYRAIYSRMLKST